VGVSRLRRARSERRTWALGLVALGMTGAALAGEVARVWRRGSAPLPTETTHVLGAGGVAVRETVAVARAGYEGGTAQERALLNLLGSFSASFALVRGIAHGLRGRHTWGPFRNVVVKEAHIHHFVPGIVLAFLAGGASVISRDQDHDAVLAVPFGVGVALTLDESALLLKLDDVYWSEEGIVSVQITLAALALLAAGALALKLLRRGEQVVLPVQSAAWSAPRSPSHPRA
jgi:hypothetical protein